MTDYESEKEIARLNDIIDAMRADAALGALVRQMPQYSSLEHQMCGWGAYSWRTQCRYATPEASLQAFLARLQEVASS